MPAIYKIKNIHTMLSSISTNIHKSVVALPRSLRVVGKVICPFSVVYGLCI